MPEDYTSQVGALAVGGMCLGAAEITLEGAVVQNPETTALPEPAEEEPEA